MKIKCQREYTEPDLSRSELSTHRWGVSRQNLRVSNLKISSSNRARCLFAKIMSLRVDVEYKVGNVNHQLSSRDGFIYKQNASNILVTTLIQKQLSFNKSDCLVFLLSLYKLVPSNLNTHFAVRENTYWQRKRPIERVRWKLEIKHIQKLSSFFH